MLFRHKEFVKNHLGYAEENIILIENGDVLELDGERALVTNKREVGRTFIDEICFEEISRATVKERRQIAADGMVTLVVIIDGRTGELQAPPQIVSRGVRGFETPNGGDGPAIAPAGGDSSLAKAAQEVVIAAVTGASRQMLEDESLLKEHVRVELKRFIQKQTGARPVIMPVLQTI
jgi:ribonuclease J